MKVLEVVDGRNLTGAVAAALSAAVAMAARGHRVTWLGEPGPRPVEAARRAGLEVVPRLGSSPLGPFAAAAAIRELSAEADLVHVHRSAGHLAALLGMGGSGRARPLVRTWHPGTAGAGGVWARWLALRCDALVVRSSETLMDMARRIGVARAPTVSLVPGGVDVRTFHPGVDGSAMRRELCLDGRTVIGVVSHLKPGRHLEDFCAAAESLALDPAMAELAFLLIGRGRNPLEPRFEARLRRPGLSGRLLLHDPLERFPEALAVLDVGVILSPGSDGSARAALELAALGKPLILGRVGALTDLAGPAGERARLVAPDSPTELAAALRELVRDVPLRRRLAAAALLRVREHHTLERLGEGYEAVFAGALEARG